MALTPKKKAVLDFITGFLATHGFSPTLKEIANGVDLRSTGSLCKHIQALKRLGYVTDEYNRNRSINRSIRLVRKGNAILWERRTNDFRAYLEGDPGRWGCGRTIAEAVGDLVMSHGTELNLTVQPATRTEVA